MKMGNLKVCVFETRMGFVALAKNGNGIYASTLPERSGESAVEALGMGRDVSYSDTNVFGDLTRRVQSYFEGRMDDFADVTLDMDGISIFHRRVMQEVRKIPPGEVMSYSEVARLAGSPRAARSAGSAMARNRLPIFVPCHRVVAAGSIGGFGSDVDLKKRLLAHEGNKDFLD